MANWANDNLWGLDALWGDDDLTGQAAAGVARLIAQFADPLASPNLHKTVSIVGDRTTKMLEVLGQILVAYRLDTAVGDQLDAIGERLDRPRYGLDDELYRKVLRIKAKLVLPSQGTAPMILEMCRTLAEPGRAIKIYDAPPAQFILTVEDISILEAQILEPFIRDAKAGGVGVHFGYTPVDALIVDSSQNPINPDTKIASSQGAGTTVQGKVSSVIVI